jgi:hypothetical protein
MKRLADSLFLIQITCLVIFALAQGQKLITSSQGVSITWYVFMGVSGALNLSLGIGAHRAKPSRVTRQMMASSGFLVAIVLCHGTLLLANGCQWDLKDTVTSLIGVTGILVTVLTARRTGVSLRHPLVRGWIVIFCGCVPTLLMAMKIWQVGGAGVAGAVLVTGHLSKLARLFHLCFSYGEAKWDQNRRAALFTEVMGEVAWVLVTIAWLRWTWG